MWRILNQTATNYRLLSKSPFLLSRFKRKTTELLLFSQLNVPTSRFLSTSLVRLQQQQDDRDPNKKNDKKKDDYDNNNKLGNLAAKAILWIMVAYIGTMAASLLLPGQPPPDAVRFVSWNEFVHQMLAKGEVEQLVVRPDVDIVTIILHEGAVVKGKRVEHRTFHMQVVDAGRFEERLRAAEHALRIRPSDAVPIIYERSSDAAGRLLAALIVAALLATLLSKNNRFRPPISFDSFTQMGRAKFTLVDGVAGGKGVRFTDVAGLEQAKIEVMEFVDYLKRPEHYQSLGARVPKGALLLGPPGCGKTLLAKAVATEANVPFLSMNGSEFIELIGGLGAARVRDLFREARRRSPCIVYIDEIDAIGKRRGETTGATETGTTEGDQTLNQLLVEMDGMAGSKGVLFLASTNRADVLDPALLRPGRFDRHILIDLPNLHERQSIFERHLQDLKLEHPPSRYSARLARLSAGCSGADIANICNESALLAAREKRQQVTADELELAVQRVLGGAEKRSAVVAPDERHRAAVQEAGRAVSSWMLQNTDVLLKISIVPRTSLALGFSHYAKQEQYLYTKEDLDDRMCVLLGGRVAETLIFGNASTTPRKDLDQLTKMAYAQVRKFGMNKAVGLISYDTEEEAQGGRRPYSKQLSALMDEEVRRISASVFERTKQLLEKHKDLVVKLAEALEKHETLNYEQVEQILGPLPYPSKKTAASLLIAS